MNSEQKLEMAGFVVVFDRPSTPDEQKRLKKNRVIDSATAEEYSNLSTNENRILAGLPKEAPIEHGPISEIDLLKVKTDDPYFDQMLDVIVNTYNSKYTNSKNEEIRSPLIPVIYKAWKKFLSEYSFTDHENDKRVRNEETMWRVIYAIADNFHRKKSFYLSEAFLKLYDEGTMKRHEIDTHTKIGAAQLAKMGLAKYVPEWPTNIRYEQKDFGSFKEFHENIKKLVEKSVKEYKEIGQSTLVFEKAHEVILAREKGKNYMDKFYGKGQD